MQVAVRRNCLPDVAPSAPLWKRVPTHDEDGHSLGDFMMLFPGLRDRPQHDVEATIESIQRVFATYPGDVVFADLNLQLNLLWISVRPRQGIIMDIATSIYALVPDARLVAHKYP